MAKKSSAAKGRAGNPLPAASQTDDGAHGVTRPTKLKPSSLLDTRVIYCGDNLEQLANLPDACVDLIYIDPPFNSNRNYEVFWGETKKKRACVSAFRNCIGRQLLLPLRLARHALENLIL